MPKHLSIETNISSWPSGLEVAFSSRRLVAVGHTKVYEKGIASRHRLGPQKITLVTLVIKNHSFVLEKQAKMRCSNRFDRRALGKANACPLAVVRLTRHSLLKRSQIYAKVLLLKKLYSPQESLNIIKALYIVYKF